MTLQEELQSLQSELESAKTAATAYEVEIFEPAIKEIQKAFNLAMKSDHGLEAVMNDSSIYIQHPDRAVGRVNLYIDRGCAADRAEVSLSYYSTIIRPGNEVDIQYINLVGQAASALSQINETVNTIFYPQIQGEQKKLNHIWSSCKKIESEILRVENLIKVQTKEKYKEVGKEYILKTTEELEWNYSTGEYKDTLISKPAKIVLYYGRSKKDKTFTSNYTIKGVTKKKWTIEVSRYSNSTEYTLSEDLFEQFIESVYAWEEVQADRIKKQAEEELKQSQNKVGA